MTATIISLASILLGGGLIGGILLHQRESPKAKADAARTIAETALKVAENLEKRVELLESQKIAYINYAEILRAHINAGSPPPPPDWPEILKSIA